MIFSNSQFWPLLAISIAALLILAWLAWNRSDLLVAQKAAPWLFRAAGILLVAFALVDPLLIEETPLKGANVIAVVADDSSGLRIKDEGEILDRAEIARKHLSGSDSSWRETLADTYQLRNYRFDHALHRVGDFNTLTFGGNHSELGTNLMELKQRLDGKPLAGIILFTDGLATDAPLSEEALAQLPPVYPVALGSRKEIPDLAITDLQVEQSAFADSPLVLKAGLSQNLAKEAPVIAELSQIKASQGNVSTPVRNVLIDQKNTLIDAAASTEFEWQTEGGGVQFFSLDVEPRQDEQAQPEVNEKNNRRLFAVDKGKSEYRILYVSGRPNWEYKFLNRALAEDSRLSIVGLIRVATKEPKFEFKGRAGENSNSLYRGFGREDENERYDEAVLIRIGTRDEKELLTGFPSEAEELFEYDAIVIDDLEAEFFTFTQQTLVRDFVKQRGGGLLMLGGVSAFREGGYANTPIAQTLPVYLSKGRNSDTSRPPVIWELTRNGWVAPWTRIRSVDSDERLRLQDMPLFQVYNQFDRTKPGSETLISIQIPGAHRLPALVTRKFGSGRVATLAVGDLWRWGLQDAGAQADLAQFWRQLSRWLVTDTPQQVMLSAAPSSHREIVLNARAFDENYKPLQLGDATVSIQNLSKPEEARQLSMQAIPEKPGQFVARFTATEAGPYLARLQVSKSNGDVVGSAETGWVTQPTTREFARNTPDREYLARIAEATGGQLLELDELGTLDQVITQRPNPIMQTSSVHAWHNNWLYLLALGSFLAEWLLRRKRGLA